LNVDTLDTALVDDTLSTILKYEGDIRKAQQELKEHVAKARAKSAATAPTVSVPRRTSCTEPDARRAVDDKLITFVGLLRQNGIRVSFAESMDTFRALDLIGLGTRTGVKDVLRSTLVKRAVDVPTYDALFDLYFSGVGEIVKRSESSAMDALELDPAAYQQLLEDLARFLAGAGESSRRS
jgi:uncharacterized protein with von Willebrand factor type A (vWA) domain